MPRRAAGVALALLLPVLLVAGVSCRREPTVNDVRHGPIEPQALLGSFEEIAIPAAAGAGQAFVSPSGASGALVSWLEPAGTGRHALKFARVEGSTISEARGIATRDDFFINFADFPSIVDANGALFVHWLQKRGKGSYAYDVHMAASSDAGATWSESIVVHDDRLEAEHGFASLVPLGKPGSVGVVWLDGRNMSGEGEGHDHSGGDMTLRYAEADASLVLSQIAELDARTCECCTTAIAMTPAGPFVAFRDRSAGEIRDIGITRRRNASWTASSTLANDGWKIEGCPVNGPQADSRGNTVAVAWFTAANEHPAVRVAFSSDAGASFATPIDVAGGSSTGYVDCAFVADDRVAISWIEDDGMSAKLRVREVLLDGTSLPVTTLASIPRGRNGFPRLAASGASLYAVWSEKGDSPRIHLARASVGK